MAFDANKMAASLIVLMLVGAYTAVGIVRSEGNDVHKAQQGTLDRLIDKHQQEEAEECAEIENGETRDGETRGECFDRVYAPGDGKE